MKQYNGEKAIISLTSWRARINTVAKTIFNILKVCPGFHIVLVLSEEEFPQKEKELPENLKLILENDLFEILWVYKNVKSYKKIVYTMEKYPDVPIISADDDCIYHHNYADVLYNRYISSSKNKGIYYCDRTKGTGYGALFTPDAFNHDNVSRFISDEIIKTENDDVFYSILLERYKSGTYFVGVSRNLLTFHDSIEPISGRWNQKKDFNAREITRKYINK